MLNKVTLEQIKLSNHLGTEHMKSIDSCLFLSSVVSLGVAEASILLMLIFLRRRVRVAIAMLREASKYEL